MNTSANVLYAYSPKNDDELELKVGDKIEVIGFEEEGWWKGKLKGKIGVFPSNFVQVVEQKNTSGNQSITNLPAAVTANSTPNKLSLFGKASKTSLSTNSLNSNNSNSNNNISNSNNNNNLIMNNTQHQENNEEASITSSERRPKPVRGLGFGDNFGPSIKSKLIPNDLASDRLTTANLVNILQKQIPKKPPPPAPIHLDNGSTTTSTLASAANTATTDQAPALPPKPANQFSPHLHHSRLLPTAQQHQLPPPPLPHQQHQANHQQVREQAEVIYAYEPTNDDELELKAGDIIDIINKDIEDQGWWKGELNGKIGVFPDNFVRLIEVSEPSVSSHQEWHHQHRVTTTPGPPPTSSQPSTPIFNQINENRERIKSVFAATPKGFTQELESNLEKNNSPAASFLSLKRNKLAQQQLPASSLSASSTATVAGTTMGELNLNDGVDVGRREDTGVGASMDSNTLKLNHITANRAKGPLRKPPSNVLIKRNQLDVGRKESNGRDDIPLGSLPINPTNNSNFNSHLSTIHDSLSSLPTGQHTLSTTSTPSNPTSAFATTITPTVTTTSTITSTIGNILQTKPDVTPTLVPTFKSSLSMDNVLENNQLPVVTKTSQCLNQAAALDKNKSAASPPPWMLELKKAHAEKKRDTPNLAVAATATVATTVATTALTTTATSTTTAITPSAVLTTTLSATSPALSSSQYDNLLKQISKDVTSEIKELREEVKRLREDLREIDDLKNVLEVMKLELKTCQSATENQKRYIKELVNNLSDERKKIAAMQVEIDRNLK